MRTSTAFVLVLWLLCVGCGEDPTEPGTSPSLPETGCEPGATMACGCGELGGSSTATCLEPGTWGPCECIDVTTPDSLADVAEEASAPTAPTEPVALVQPVSASAHVESPNHKISLTLGTPQPAARLEGENHHLLLGPVGPGP